MTNPQIKLDIDAILSKYGQNSFEFYYSALKRENEKVNLVSRETIDSMLPQLTAESLIPFEYINRGSFERYLDIGSGGGFPSIPIILSGKVENAVLLERIGKKATALGKITQSIELNRVEVVNRNYEECSFKQRFDLITMRLVKLNNRLLKNISKNLSENGNLIYYFKPDFQIDDSVWTVVTYSYSTSPDSPDKFFSVISKKI